jgi:transposase
MPGNPVSIQHQRHARLLSKTLYKARARIEQAVGKLKRFKRIALRCEKTIVPTK